MHTLQALLLTTTIIAAQPEPAPMPNVEVSVSADFINALVQRRVDRVQPVDQDIFGTHYLGTSRTIGQLHVELVPSRTHGVLDMILQGTTWSCSTGYRDPFKVETRTIIPFGVRKRISIDGGLIWPYPAAADAVAQGEILAVTNLKGEDYSLPVHFARNRAFRDKPATEAETSNRARYRLAKQFDDEVYADLKEAHAALAGVLNFFRKRDLTPRPFVWSTTTDRLTVRIPFPTPHQPALRSSPPAVANPTDHEIAIHQSFFNELGHSLLAGKTFTSLELVQTLEKLIASALPVDSLHAELAQFVEFTRKIQGTGLQPPDMTFSRDKPINVTLANKGFSVLLTRVQFKNGDRSYPPIDIKADFKIERAPDGRLGAFRKDPVSIVYSDGGDLPLVLRARLQPFFSSLLDDDFFLPDVPLPDANGSKRGQLVLSQADADEGWLRLGWKREPAK